MARAACITVAGLTKTYGGVAVLDAVSFDVAEGEFLTFLGPSGCGKTTTLRCIAGFIKPDGGSIMLGSQDLTRIAPHRRNLGMVFQNYALFPHLKVIDNVGFGLSIRGIGQSEAAARIARALDMVRLSGLADRYPKQLSGGQQQRVALARALVYEPRVLLLDEPLSNLDAKLRVEMRSEIRALQQRLGITALYVTHDQEEALSVSDRVMVMNRGRIEQISTPWELYTHPRTSFVASFVGTSNLLAARSSTRPGMVRVEDSFEIPLPTDGLPPGELRLVVRPEDIAFSAAETCDTPHGSALGTLRSLTLLGPNLRAEIALRDGLVLLADRPHGGRMPDMRAGDRVRVTLDPSRVTAVPADASSTR